MGYCAALCVLIATIAPRLGIVRIASLGANIFFVAYGIAEELMPVMLLHAILLPVNAYWVFSPQLAPVQSSTTLPEVPESIAANPAAKSSFDMR